MSAFVDAQRREEALAARVEKGKALMLKLQDVLRYETEGLSEAEMARRLGVEHRVVSLWRYVLRLSTRVPRDSFLRIMRNADRRNEAGDSL
ncbi:MAG: hypothetical protein IT371_09960 [Deltaproteobacteria bacterium]|nr:hypothetical protein [Deltaproteobacteria bacterium]